MSAIALDSNNYAAGKDIDERKCSARRQIVLKPKAGQPARTGDHAPERFAKRRAPGPHRPDIPSAWFGHPVRVSVEEAKHVSPSFLAAKYGRTVEPHTGGFARSVIDPPCVPDWPAPRADERPALLGRSNYCAGG